ncbi:hypothetical protein UA08_07722 [Talaromyces atroroseus]|uniref:BTB domain-containing protein n=1 Tax=Talaromyces atroroseus TaxID=1441469 RepID=A0A225AD14_TALAT|nr:hypothetical protein UA08_07722 [Talaromyces atroroseus]OKL56823.1 hypothetical protein UA08_07722 [Talaromyces atroroseus]
MSESPGSSESKVNPRSANVLDLEADGVVSVYVNGKFAWQLPKKILYVKVPSAIPKFQVEDDDPIGAAPAVWEIKNCSEEAFRLFNEWLYNSRGQLKEPLPGSPINVYFELNQLASVYQIPDLAIAVSKVIQKFFDDSENMSAVSKSYADLPPKSPDRATISGRFAALVLTKQLKMDIMKPLIESTDLTRDLLIWLVICKQYGLDNDGYQKIFDWMGENYQVWVEAQE